MIYFLAIFAILKLIDVYSTWLCLKQSVNSEGNALMRAAMDKFGVVHTLLADFGLSVGLIALLAHSLSVLIWLIILAFQALIAANNVQAYRGKPTPIGAVYAKLTGIFK